MKKFTLCLGLYSCVNFCAGETSTRTLIMKIAREENCLNKSNGAVVKTLSHEIELPFPVGTSLADMQQKIEAAMNTARGESNSPILFCRLNLGKNPGTRVSEVDDAHTQTISQPYPFFRKMLFAILKECGFDTAHYAQCKSSKDGRSSFKQHEAH